ncbi:MAG: hypothetical protein QXH03_07815 [Candidatus Bathyarchaeia archaeon]
MSYLNIHDLKRARDELRRIMPTLTIIQRIRPLPKKVESLLLESLEKIGELEKIHSDDFQVLAVLSDIEEVIMRALRSTSMPEQLESLNTIIALMSKLNGMIKASPKGEEL